MTPEQFAYWLQGYTELTSGQQPTPGQWQSITEHLKTVFVKVTPTIHQKSAVGPSEDPDKQKAYDDALRRFNESQQRAVTPYNPGQNSPYWGLPLQVIC